MPRITLDCGRAYDFTPVGKRRWRHVATRTGSQLRWYVSGRRYHSLPPTAANARLSATWAANAGAPDNLPQPWSAF